MSLRPASVSRGSRSASILLSRKFASYWPSPRPRSHPPRPWQGSKYVQDIRAVPPQCLASLLIREAGIDSADSRERVTGIGAIEPLGHASGRWNPPVATIKGNASAGEFSPRNTRPSGDQSARGSG